MRLNISEAHLEYWDHKLPAIEIEKIQNDAVKFAEQRFENFEVLADEYFSSGESFDDFFGDLIDDHWAEFEYEEFKFESIYQAYPEDENQRLPEPFATDLYHYALNRFSKHLEKLLSALKPDFEDSADSNTAVSK